MGHRIVWLDEKYYSTLPGMSYKDSHWARFKPADCDPVRRRVRFISFAGRFVMSRREPEFDHGLVTETKKKVKRPPLYKVLLHNDDYTTKEFVVQVLQYVFHKEQTEAVQIMLHVHKKGIGVAGVYTYEIAETKVALVENLARQHEYPLKCTMEEA
jgi:ATP-dependent Clp protease adaptor protein ClpS